MGSLIRATFREFLDDDAPRLAAALSYFTVFSLPPLLVLLTRVAGYVWDPAEVRGGIADEIEAVLGAGGAEQVRAMMEHAGSVVTDGSIGTILSVGALLFGATGAFVQLQGALNRAWDVRIHPEKGGIVALVTKRVLSFGMVLVIAFLLVVSLVLSAALAAAGSLVAAALPGPFGPASLWTFDSAISLVVITALFMVMFRVLPDVEIAWSDVWLGALSTAVLFVVGKFLFGVYVEYADPGAVFGAAGSLAVILLWIYYSAMIVLLGAEFTQVHAARAGRHIRPDANAISLS